MSNLVRALYWRLGLYKSDTLFSRAVERAWFDGRTQNPADRAERQKMH